MSDNDAQRDRRNELTWKVFLGFQMFLLTICLAALKTIWSGQYDLNNRVIVIESSVCTAASCAQLHSDIVSVKHAVAALPKEVPPPWFQQKVQELERAVSDLEKEIWGSQRRGAERSD